MKMTLEIQLIIDEAVERAKLNSDGRVANYIPELAQADPEQTGVCVRTLKGDVYVSGNVEKKISLQSVSKLIVLTGLLEEFGAEEVFTWVGTEPSGRDFDAIATLDKIELIPTNPMLNAGAIKLCSHIPGDSVAQIAWLEKWMERAFGEPLNVDQKVLISERATGDRNRALAYLMKSRGLMNGDVNSVLDTYFSLCSFEVSLSQAAYLPLLLANGGKNTLGEQIISKQTARQVLSIMTTCGLYNESGSHLVQIGIPAKSGVSGLIVASAINQAGIAVFSPRVNDKGTSIRSEMILSEIAKKLDWHFAF